MAIGERFETLQVIAAMYATHLSCGKKGSKLGWDSPASFPEVRLSVQQWSWARTTITITSPPSERPSFGSAHFYCRSSACYDVFTWCMNHKPFCKTFIKLNLCCQTFKKISLLTLWIRVYWIEQLGVTNETDRLTKIIRAVTFCLRPLRSFPERKKEENTIRLSQEMWIIRMRIMIV